MLALFSVILLILHQTSAQSLGQYLAVDSDFSIPGLSLGSAAFAYFTADSRLDLFVCGTDSAGQRTTKVYEKGVFSYTVFSSG